jgi:hypothetical protein
MFDPFFSNYGLFTEPSSSPPLLPQFQILRSSKSWALVKVVRVRGNYDLALMNVRHIVMWLLEDLFYSRNLYQL